MKNPSMAERKPRYAKGDIMTAEDGDVILVKGDLTPDEFNMALDRQTAGYDPFPPERINRDWWRCGPAHNVCDGYGFLLYRAKPHSRGAFEATWVVLE